ncbi:MAG: ABC transporter ATP-binding protein [Candidatus Cloacimonetes bacterium]|nr:ABC transporter ATP-binding protein [Candidatus Cloacimonadota bacterium]
MLTLNNLSRSFKLQDGSDLKILSDLNLSSSSGESIAIIGPSGSGKTTLLSLIAGLERPTSGQVIVDSLDLNQMSEKKLARFRSSRIGIVFQQFHLMPHLNALENVCLPLWLQKNPEAENLARASLDSVGMSHRTSHHPWQLSGGECQRVAIARAIVTSPALILADEPTGNLDPENAKAISDLLLNLSRVKNISLVIVTHSISLANRCDKKLQLAHGKLQNAVDSALL